MKKLLHVTKVAPPSDEGNPIGIRDYASKPSIQLLGSSLGKTSGNLASPSKRQKSHRFSSVSLHSGYLASVSETHCSHLARNGSRGSLLDPQRGRFYYSPIVVMDGTLTPSRRKREREGERLGTQSGRANVWPR